MALNFVGVVPMASEKMPRRESFRRLVPLAPAPVALTPTAPHELNYLQALLAGAFLGAGIHKARRCRHSAMRVEGSYSGMSNRPGEGSVTERVEGSIGSFAWYDPTRAASALIRMRTDTPEWQLSKIAAEGARMGTKWRCSQIGVDWDAEVGQLDTVQDDLEECYQQVLNPLVEYPTYYLEPFHAYPDGNLSWKAAKEYESAGLAVFADLFSDKPSLTGSAQFRDSFRQATKQMADVMLGRPLNPKVIVDIGCGVGLSTRRWGLVFPDAKVLGIDLSPYFLALAQYRLKQDGGDPNITFMHAAGEDTKLPEGSVDLVTLTTVMHELPRSAATRIFLEARRILKPGGVLSFVDMDPTEAFMKYLDGYAGLFKYGIRATEPHLIEYCTIDFEKLLKECGFSAVSRSRNTTRHCTYTACMEGASVSEGTEKFHRPRLYNPRLLIDSLDPIRKDMLLKNGNLREFAHGETIFTQGSEADVVYMLQSGSCEANAGGRTVQTFTEQGDCFGDLFWLCNYQKRRTNVLATSPCTALRLTPSFLNDLLSDTEIRRLKFAAAEKFGDLAVGDANDHGLYLSTPQTALTSGLSLLDRFPVVQRSAGTEIVRQGDAGSEIYVVKKGECVASVGDERTLCFCKGNYFGEIAALEGTPRAATVVAENDVELWVLTASEFEEIRTAVWSPNVVLWH